MSVTQISVFSENQPGHLAAILDDFTRAGINVRGFTAADTGDFGIVRFIVDNPDRAKEILDQSGCACATSQIVCLKLEDVPGELGRVMGLLGERNINIEYCYSLISTYIALCTSDVVQTESVLRDEGFTLLTQQDVASTL